MRADQITPAHIGSEVSIADDGFGASGVLAGVYAVGAHTVVLHIEAGGSSGTVILPFNADVTLE